jgi:carboxypeptidase Q
MIERMSARGCGCRRRVATAVAVAALALPLGAQAPERLEYDAIHRIRQEGTQNSKVMETLSYLTDVHGPRVTNSPGMHAAAEWAKESLTALGIQTRFEPWGPFGRGWVNEKFSAMMTSPQPFILQGYPKVWSPGTDGPLAAEVVKVSASSEAELPKYRGALKGKIVLLAPPQITGSPSTRGPSFEPLITRLNDEALEKLQEDPVGQRSRYDRASPEFARLREFAKKRMDFFIAEGAVAVFEGSRGEGNGVVFVQGATPDMRQPKDARALPQIGLAAEHYGRIERILEKNLPVKVELNVQNRFLDDNLNSYNVIAELPGTDQADEVVIIGAHFDSWQAATGATDNAVSSAVVMEAMRILKATGLTPRRTIRMALWTGEEQGLLGSRAYVKEHFADPETMQLKPEHGKLEIYLNMDNGGGVFRGVYLQGNAAAGPIFDAWSKPFEGFGFKVETMRNTGGTDHLAFDAVGLPGFQFVQDELDYDTRTHHTNLDFYERAFPEDLMKNAIMMASFAYQAANREEHFPRKPLPAPRKAAAQPVPTSSR